MMSKLVGEDFQAETKYLRNRSLGNRLDWANKPEIYKNYPQNNFVSLPNPTEKTNLSFAEVLRMRRSIRSFTSEPLSLSDLAYLLWASSGIQRVEHQFEFRTAPSAGALYPIETYVVANNVEGLKQGIYHFNIENHTLEEIKLGNLGSELAHAALAQHMCAEASVVFVWTALFGRSTWKYSQRGYRYIYLDTGHIGQNLALAATSIGCGSCEVGAFYDDEINSLIDVDGKQESTICLCVVGHIK
jgi:SagB-type dehydrogenase family enzyme